MYIKRALENEIIESSKEFACITIYGARQTGKSTTIKHIFGENFNYVTLDDLSVRNYAITDPKGFLDFYSYPLVIDEIQKAPSLLNYIKIIIDNNKLEWLKNNEKTKIMK